MEEIKVTEEEKERKIHLEAAKLSAYKNLKEVYGEITSLRASLTSLAKEYGEWRDEYESTDRELAEIDGRLQKVPLKVVKKVSLDGLNKEQLLNLVEEMQNRR